ncbi:MAG: hypothetical protein ACR2QE_01310 [Acidimicrobiales bacterium]
MLRRAAAGTALAWTTPVILSAHSPVGAATGSACVPSMTRGWRSFSFGAVGTVALTRTRNFQAGGGFVDVTDAYLTGDVFTIAEDGTVCGDTSPAPNLGPGVWTNDADVAFSDARWSSGRFWFPPGTHTFTITVAISPWGSGGGFWRWGRC